MPEMHGACCEHRCEHGMFVRDRDVPSRRGTLLWIHGLGESGLCFEHLLGHPGLQTWRQLIPDLPGYGRSPWRAEPLSLEEQADWLADWLRTYPAVREAAPVVIVGHSMGGVTGLLFCERHPDLARGLVDVDGNKSLGDCTFSRRVAQQTLSMFTWKGFQQQREFVFRRGRTDPAQRGYHVSMCLADPRAYYRNSRELVIASGREDLARRLAALPLPTRYLAGVPGGACARSRELLEEAGIDWLGISPSGHWPFIDQPDRFVAALAAFLEGDKKGPGLASRGP
jgi:pimeloyl-ACP methyl ester carboxylesterase